MSKESKECELLLEERDRKERQKQKGYGPPLIKYWLTGLEEETSCKRERAKPNVTT